MNNPQTGKGRRYANGSSFIIVKEIFVTAWPTITVSWSCLVFDAYSWHSNALKLCLYLHLHTAALSCCCFKLHQQIGVPWWLSHCTINTRLTPMFYIFKHAGPPISLFQLLEGFVHSKMGTSRILHQFVEWPAIARGIGTLKPPQLISLVFRVCFKLHQLLFLPLILTATNSAQKNSL